MLGLLGVATAQEPANGLRPIPEDLLSDPHVREELAINEFTAPSIAKVFETLEDLAPLPVADLLQEAPERMPLDRADLAVELGFLIADGFLIVQIGEMGRVETLAATLTRYAKALGAGERVTSHAASLLESAREGEVEQLKKELAATQRDVEYELVVLRDPDLAHLISLGGWIHALEASSTAVDKQFSPERARHLMREDIADYYASIVGSLEPRIAERPNYTQIRDLLSGMRSEMTLGEGAEPTHEQVRAIREKATRLAELCHQRAEIK